MKILISGGHITPALAVIDYIQAHHPQDEVKFIGRQYSQPELKQKAVEESEVAKRQVEFIKFKAVKLGHETWLNKLIVKPIKFVVSVSRALSVVKQVKPDVFLSFGGYLAVPVALACKIKGIPIVTHEGTRVLGVANRILARIANFVAVSFESSQMEAGKLTNNVVVTGNPLRPTVTQTPPIKPDWIQAEFDLPILLILGGNQGSEVINQVLANCLPELLEDWTVFHQCGRANKKNDYPQQFAALKQTLPAEKQLRYFYSSWIEETDLNWLYHHAFGAISRAGINSLQELVFHRIPTVFIPLPSTHYSEQQQNAAWLSGRKAALVLQQADLTAASLTAKLQQLKHSHQALQGNLESIELDLAAEQRLYQLLVTAVHGKI